MQTAHQPDTTLTARGQRSRVKQTDRQLRLHIVRSADPAAEGQVWSLGPAAVVLGRHVDGQGQLADPAVSRQHVELRADANGRSVRVTDLESHNGTWINGERRRSDVVGHGAVVRVGGTVLVIESGVAPAVGPPPPSSNVPGRSWHAGALRQALARAAASGQTTLLAGETGTGKEHASLELHRLAGLRGPLVLMNVAAVPENLFESALFGHTAGAFTGAAKAADGRVREADGGMLVLDEIGELPLALQPKLLRLLEDCRVRPLGSDRDVVVDVRFAAATNADLEALRRDGKFRADLLARLSSNVVQLAPLRERRADVLDFADALVPLRSEGIDADSWRQVLAAETVEALLLHRWTYNLRELKSVLRGLLALCSHLPILPDDLPESMHAVVPEPPQVARQSRMPPRDELRRLLHETHGNIDAVARHYGKHRKQVYRWLRYSGITLEGLRDR